MSSFAQALLAELHITNDVGAELEPSARSAVLNFYTNLLEAAVTGSPLPAPRNALRLHCQVEFRLPAILSGAPANEPVITLSGGVGELTYRAARGEPLPGTTAFGDLGIDLARHLCASPILGRNLKSHVPRGLGRATVNGLAVHGTEVSGATLFLPRSEILPLTDLPILGTIRSETSDDEVTALLELAARAAEGACLRVEPSTSDTPTVKALGQRLAAHLGRARTSLHPPLALLTSGNIGKTLGQYATRWGRLETALVVIDEIAERRAHFATIGKPRNGLVPVSFHGLESQL
jgi:ethanolamine utilization protein EutA